MKLAALLTLLALPLHAQTLPGFDRFDLLAAHRARPVAASVWYPAGSPSYRAPLGDGPIFAPSMVLMAPAVAEGRHPLILLSHGSGGNAAGLGWLAEGLVAKGAIVLAVDHPGSTSGDSSPRRSLDLDARARDLDAALQYVLADPDFAPHIDAKRIAAIGFSLGGTTALGLAGVRFDGNVQAQNCATGPEAADCGFFTRARADFAAAKGFGADTSLPEVASAVAIDPGFGGSATPASLAAVSIPVHLINLGTADRLAAVDVSPTGNNLAARLPGASYSTFTPATHFSFLAPCKPGAEALLAEEGEDPICTDPKGADRIKLHADLIADISQALHL